jgi:hypothetical protein
VKATGDAMMELARRISPKNMLAAGTRISLLVPIKEVQLKELQPVNKRSPVIP